MSKSLHPERIGRLLDRSLYTGSLPPGSVAEAEAIVALVDAGASAGKVTAAVHQLVTDAWQRAGRDAAAAGTPRAVAEAVKRLRGVAGLEASLGLGPATETEVEPVAEAAAWGAA
jgi:hypothetical protein